MFTLDELKLREDLNAVFHYLEEGCSEDGTRTAQQKDKAQGIHIAAEKIQKAS